jgi:hydroxymethylbilane synthase
MTIRIGTRDSKLALWQAHAVADELKAIGYTTTIVPAKSKGDLDLQTPLHQMGGTGLFTKVLDDILLRGDIDIAVHSLKDYPTVSPDGIAIAAVLPREDPLDILVHKGSGPLLSDIKNAVIATGSIRRRAQWLNKYPSHRLTNLRGNVQTRMEKLHSNDWHGAIFAKAGLRRMDMIPEQALDLDWMIPAPAQGVVGIACQSGAIEIREALTRINHLPSWETSVLERAFLNTLEGGCSAPIGALAIRNDRGFAFRGGVFSVDGSKCALIDKTLSGSDPKTLGKEAAEYVLARGGHAIMQSIREDI